MRRPAAARPDAEKKSARAAEQDRADVAAARAAWRADVLPAAGRRVFVDETHVNTHMHRAYARSPRGRRAVAAVPRGHWKTLTVVAALTAGGLAAVAVVDGPMTADLFAAWVERDLVAALRPGDVVVMDNLSAHKAGRVRELVEAAGCRVDYLPAYSPDLNPIEMAFSKLKGWLRTLAVRTVPLLVEWLGWLAHLFDPDECLRYIRHCGYHATNGPNPL